MVATTAPPAFAFPFILGIWELACLRVKRAVPRVQALGTLVDLGDRVRADNVPGVLADALSSLQSLTQGFPLAVRLEQTS